MTDEFDRIRLDIDLIKEKWKRDIYARAVGEIIKRKNANECPKCGATKWYQLNIGLRKKWKCDNCGLDVDIQGAYKGQKWWDFVTLLARKEIKRIKIRKRQSQSVKTYEKDEI